MGNYCCHYRSSYCISIPELIRKNMKEENISRAIMLALSKVRCTIFRNHSGMGWYGKTKKTTSGGIIIDNPVPLKAGLTKGSSDLIGWMSVDVTPEMVGSRLAVFTAIEVKTATGRASPEQINFINKLKEAGGFAGFATNEQEAIHIINQAQNGQNRC